MTSSTITSSPLGSFPEKTNSPRPPARHKGFALTPGVAYGKAFIWAPQRALSEPEHLSVQDVSDEIEIFRNTLSTIKEELTSLQKQVAADVGKFEGEIFGFQLQILNDVVFMEKIILAIRDQKMNLTSAINHVLRQTKVEFEKIKNPLFKDKFMDIRDVLTKLKEYRAVSGIEGLLKNTRNRILVTEEVTPSLIPPSENQKIIGLVTTVGGLGSHGAILAKSYGIPGVGLADGIMDKIKEGDHLLIDGRAGLIIVNPQEDVLEGYHKTIEEFGRYRRRVERTAAETVTTLDGAVVQINANCSNAVDLAQGESKGADGIGLFRTEFMFYQHSTFPTEAEQYEIYKNILLRFPSKAVVFRTLDIGGDKFLPYFPMPKQSNPFMGWRSLKISFELPQVFKTQIRAILRAAPAGQARLLFPMVTSYRDIVKAKKYVAVCAEELAREGLAFEKNISCGAMIENPAATACLTQIAEEVDFLTIGTNDLTQHLLAVDRNNPRVAPFYVPHHPAVVAVLGEIILKAKSLEKPISLCGEMASHPYYVLLLLGLGLTNLSMAPGTIPMMKDMIRHINLRDAQEAAAHVKELKMSKEIFDYLQEMTLALYPDASKIFEG